MSEIKTVTHDGQIYQIGGLYLVNDIGSGKGNLWSPIKLTSIDPQSGWPFKSSLGEGFAFIAVIRSPQTFGTITPAPIELVDGAAYMFDWTERPMKNSVGVYDLNSQRFYFVSGHILSSYCTNIRLMTVESK
jgi:hypothetical protein